nr:isoform 2 of mrna-decapping enzyme 1b [Quercus suber]
MPSKRRTARSHQSQSQPIQSDYDTEDPNNMTDIPVALPASIPPDRTNTELNLVVLRRYCPEISHIVTIAPFSVVYIFSPESQTWEKCGIEGTLFINKLSTPDGAPRYNIMILNRKSMDNFMTDLTSADDIDITDEYVILQAKGGEEQTLQIYGLWIFSEMVAHGVSTKELIGSAVQSCAAQVQAYYEALMTEGVDQSSTSGPHGMTYEQDEYGEPRPKHAQQTTGPALDLLQLFGKAAPQAAEHAAVHGYQTQDAHTGPRSMDTRADRANPESSNPVPLGAVHQRPAQQNMLLDLFKDSR